jgi:transcriptional regulator with XRE-family HTH domain
MNLLIEKEKSQVEAAREMGISKSALNGWITGKRIPRMDNVDTMCRYFGCSRSKIIEGKDNEPQYTLSDGTIVKLQPTGFYAQYCRLSSYEQQIVRDFVDTLIAKREKKEK